MAKRQKELEGFERPNSIPELDAAAENFKSASKRRKNAQDKEIEARAVVIQLMKDNKLTVYEDRDADLIVTLSAGADKVSVEELHEKAKVEDDDDEEADPGALEKLTGRASKKTAPAPEA